MVLVFLWNIALQNFGWGQVTKKLAPSSNLTFSCWLLILCYSQHACVNVCVIETAHIFVSCARISSCWCKRGNSRTYCMYAGGTIPSSWNSLWLVTLHPQEKQEKCCVMPIVAGNCRVVVSDFKGHCMLDKSDVDWIVWFSASCCGQLGSACETGCLDWGFFRFSSVSTGKISCLTVWTLSMCASVWILLSS